MVPFISVIGVSLICICFCIIHFINNKTDIYRDDKINSFNNVAVNLMYLVYLVSVNYRHAPFAK